MSWNISLVGPDRYSVKVDRHEEGGTYAIGGTEDATLNVTYNYGKLFAFRSLDGMSAKDSIPIMQQKIDSLGDARGEDYWQPTEGNVKHALSILLRWAEQHKDADCRWAVL